MWLTVRAPHQSSALSQLPSSNISLRKPFLLLLNGLFHSSISSEKPSSSDCILIIVLDPLRPLITAPRNSFRSERSTQLLPRTDYQRLRIPTLRPAIRPWLFYTHGYSILNTHLRQRADSSLANLAESDPYLRPDLGEQTWHPPAPTEQQTPQMAIPHQRSVPIRGSFLVRINTPPNYNCGAC